MMISELQLSKQGPPEEPYRLLQARAILIWQPTFLLLRLVQDCSHAPDQHLPPSVVLKPASSPAYV